MAGIQDELFNLTNTAFVFQDPEDNSDEDTTAKLAYNATEDDDDDDDINQPSKLRQRAAVLLSETDKKYAGKRTSRKDLDSEDDDSELGSEDAEESGNDIDDDEDDNDDNDNEADSDEEDESDNNISEFTKTFSQINTDKEFTFVDDGDYSKYADDDDDNVDDDDSVDDDGDDEDSKDIEEDENEDDEEDDIDEDEEDVLEDGGIHRFSSSADDDVAKGHAAQQQLGLWDSLLEGRIKLQKAVAIINQLPQTDTWTQYRQSSAEFSEESSKTHQILQHLLDSLIHLQDLLLFQNTETKSLLQTQSSVSPGKKAAAPPPDDDDDDEEITSESDMDEESDKKKQDKVSDKRETIARPVKRKMKMDDYSGFLKKRHEDFQNYRNGTIQKWHDKTRLATGNIKGKNFSAFDQSAISQINQILGDKDRLVKRTQLKRTVYRVLGTMPKRQQPEPTPDENGETETAKEGTVKDYDKEIYDDDDFYHQLLRELIEKKTTDINDPVALSKQWLEIQKLRSKTKKKVDTKASKGRKVRYDIHKKLVNFMAPVDTCQWSHDARDDLFKSLFGKRFAGGTGS